MPFPVEPTALMLVEETVRNHDLIKQIPTVIISQRADAFLYTV